ncbi:glycosyltransferase family 2 protein [candidate division WWE3 bacterium]|uniref:dolichyl-phosphate beta-glucosyltransferase n=1 Tax=candidate division WWE3 bacterium TaxID=2053526 RepID=A0A955LV25_UNCKA|nr:glycosyltransferase family 2 protein [candidate division WWE3 bacterium]
MTLSVVIPAFNEANRITKTITEATQYIENNLQLDYEIVIVNDGSTDNTNEVVRQLAEKYKNIRLVQYENNHGKGYALKQGVFEADGDLILTIDADGSTPFGEISKLLTENETGNGDVIIGSRHISGSHIVIKQPWYRVVISRLANRIIRWTILPGIHDTQCGFKLFNGDAAKNIFAQTIIYGFGNDMEILILAKEMNYRIVEVPVVWLDSKDSTLRPIRSTLKTFIELLRIIYRYRLQSSTN